MHDHDELMRLADEIMEESVAGWTYGRSELSRKLRTLAQGAKTGGVPDATKELRALYKHHVNTLEYARDQIIARGGECDTVDVMEMRCPVLKRVRDVLAAPPTAAQHEGTAVDEALRMLRQYRAHTLLGAKATQSTRPRWSDLRAAIDTVTAALAPQPKTEGKR